MSFQVIRIASVGGTVGAVSAATFILQSILSSRSTVTRGKDDHPASSHSLRSLCNSPVFKCRVLRVAACLTFLVLTCLPSTHPPEETSNGQRRIASVSALYAVCLVLVSLTSSRLSNAANTHLNVLSLAFFGVFAYRDLFPLLTFDGEPVDAGDGVILWLKVASLFISAIIIPLVVPRQRYPPSAEDLAASDVNPEETASILSLLTHSYLDPFIFRMYRKPALSADELPRLASADRSEVLMPDVLSILDPLIGGQHYLFWGLVIAYKRRVSMLIGLQLLQLALSFIAPIGINQVLRYIENNGEGATIRPWVWVSWLFFGPFLRAIFSQLYTHIACRNHVQINGVLNQLIFQHALRIRIDTGNLSEGRTKSNNFTGKINNLVTSDVAEVAGLAEVWIIPVCFPFQLALSLWFLYDILDWSAFVGFGFMALCTPVPGYITGLMRGVQVVKKRKTDARVQSVTEALGVLRMVKLFGWERRLQSRITSVRREELSYVKKSKILDLMIGHVNVLIPMCTMIVTYAVYTLLLKKELTASTVFASMAVFENLRLGLRHVVVNIPGLVQGKVSMDRIDDFLKKTELLDKFTLTAAPESDVIGFRDVEFKWSGEKSRNFVLKLEGEYQFRKDYVNLIIGPTGSGKTSLILALLGEMRCSSLGPNSYHTLPRHWGVSYFAQESYVQNDTIRNNIIFGSEFDEERYNHVLYQCALLRDLSLFEAGDMTEVGEKGLTLSGGQKASQARVTLARAVYSSAGIVILDDPLSALDVHTAKWIVDRCLRGPLMQGRTILLVTHNIALTRPIAQHVTFIALDGNIVQGSADDVILADQSFAAQWAKDEKGLEYSSDTNDVEEKPGTIKHSLISSNGGGLTVAEEMEEGHVSWPAFQLYLGSMNHHPIWFLSFAFSLIFLSAIVSSLQSWFLGYWSSQYDTKPASEVQVPWLLSVYILLVFISLALYTGGFTIWTLGSVRASSIVHLRFIDAIMRSTFRWLDITPTAMILTRATIDMNAIDDSLSRAFWQVLESSNSMVVRLGSVMVFAPVFLVPGVAIALLGGYLGSVYMAAQLPLRRLRANARAPVLGHFTAAMAGLVSIRAYGAQEAFLHESQVRIDAWFRPGLLYYNANRWIAIRADALAGIFTAALGGYLVYGNSGTSAANSGFSLSMAVGFTSLILTWVRLLNGAELEANSLERIQGFMNIEHEEASKPQGVPPAYWPASGDLRVEGFCARYSKNGPDVLHDLTFHIRSGERIGIVGRTGSGKSSLTLSLLRAIPTSGQVFYDGVSTNQINLDALRSYITIIPQVPELLSGSLRTNLDPFSEHDDARLNDALRSAGLFDLQSEDAQDKLDLDSEIGGGGNNLSVGQRQIIALARAIVRGSKLLVLDEATSSIDHRTDSIIQETLRHELNDVTLLTVAHRLATVMDFDRIMVLDEGKIVEFDSPRVLLEKEGGLFRALVDQSSDRADLYTMVQRRPL